MKYKYPWVFLKYIHILHGNIIYKLFKFYLLSHEDKQCIAMMPKCYVCWKSNIFNLSILVLEITLLLLLLNWGICRSQWLPSLSVYDDDNVDKTIVKIYAIQTQPYHANEFTCKRTHKCTKSHTFKKKSARTSLLCICGSSNTWACMAHKHLSVQTHPYMYAY